MSDGDDSVRVPRLRRPVIGEAEIAEVVDSLRSGWIGTGPKVSRFERMLEEYVGRPVRPLRLVLHRGAHARR